jgi:hypothetical protein
VIKNSTRVCNRDFTRNGVTPCHFVTPGERCDPQSIVATPRGSAVVVRRSFQPEPAALEALVDALYGLLVDSPPSEPVSASDPPKSSCFSVPPE